MPFLIQSTYLRAWYACVDVKSPLFVDRLPFLTFVASLLLHQCAVFSSFEHSQGFRKVTSVLSFRAMPSSLSQRGARFMQSSPVCICLITSCLTSFSSEPVHVDWLHAAVQGPGCPPRLHLRPVHRAALVCGWIRSASWKVRVCWVRKRLKMPPIGRRWSLWCSMSRRRYI